MGNAHQPLVEPTHNVIEPLDAVPRLAGPRELVRLTRKDNHRGGPFEKLQRTEQLFAARVRRRAVIGFAENEHHRRVNVLHECDR